MALVELSTPHPALVTGASRGLGRTMAVGLAQLGAPVVVNYTSNEAAAADCVSEIVAAGGRAVAIRANVAKPEEARALAEKATNAFGPIGILVNNAGIGPREGVFEATEANWHEVIATNLTSAFLLTQALIPSMRDRKWGRIIFLSSIAAATGGLISAAYAASKAGCEGLSHFYAAQLVGHGITANAIAPALVESDMLRAAGLSPQQTPLGRFGRAEEVAMVVQMLACNAYITGQTIHVNAGRYMT
jgi:3-oxoacyl-[acyl-carrier protein] reductase